MAKRNSKTVAQQCRYYEVDNIFEYMVEVYINGNFTSFRRLYHELDKKARKDFIAFLILECPPQYHIEILQKSVICKKQTAFYCDLPCFMRFVHQFLPRYHPFPSSLEKNMER